jgi:GntR family transcriptional regulator
MAGPQMEETDGDVQETHFRAERTGKLGYQPLYKRVKSLLVARIADGRWQPGQSIPNEFQIAEELSVSQGTVRKALHEMTLDNLLVRRQGRGTFVTSYDDERILR